MTNTRGKSPISPGRSAGQNKNTAPLDGHRGKAAAGAWGWEVASLPAPQPLCPAGWHSQDRRLRGDGIRAEGAAGGGLQAAARHCHGDCTPTAESPRPEGRHSVLHAPSTWGRSSHPVSPFPRFPVDTVGRDVWSLPQQAFPSAHPVPRAPGREARGWGRPLADLCRGRQPPHRPRTPIPTRQMTKVRLSS